VFQRLFRVFVRSLVIFLAMMCRCRAVSVRGEIVQFGSSLMGVVWHGVSFRTINSSRWTTPENWHAFQMEHGSQGQLPSGQTAKVRSESHSHEVFLTLASD
jgi:hypothetical protein